MNFKKTFCKRISLLYCSVVVSKSVYYVPFLVLVWYFYLPLQKTQRTISVLGVGWFHLNCMMHLKQGHVLQQDNRDLWSTGGERPRAGELTHSAYTGSFIIPVAKYLVIAPRF